VSAIEPIGDNCIFLLITVQMVIK